MNNKVKKREITIPYPNEDTLNRSVEYIVDLSLGKQNVFTEFINMVKTVPLRLVFNSKIILLFIAVLYMVAIAYVDITNLYKDPAHYYRFISLLAPTAFMIGLLDIVNSKEYNMIGLEMSTKYNFQQLAAYKIVVLFLYSVLLNIVLLLMTPIIANQQNLYENSIQTVDAMLMMFSTLFVISSISLAILLRFNSRYLPFIMLTCWYAFIILCAFIAPTLFEQSIWLANAQILAVVMGAILHIEQIRFIFSHKFLEKGVV